jgi:hypothetical protein
MRLGSPRAHQMNSGASFSASVVALPSSSLPCVLPLQYFVLILTGPIFSYICSRIYLHHPPGQNSDSEDMPHPEITAEALRKELELAERQPDVNPVSCIITLIITVGLMGVTAEFVRLLRRLGPIVIFTSPLPVARREHTVCPTRIKNQRRVRFSYRKLMLKSHLMYSRIIDGSASSCSRSRPSPPTAPSPSCSSSVPACDSSSRHRSLQKSWPKHARST